MTGSSSPTKNVPPKPQDPKSSFTFETKLVPVQAIHLIRRMDPEYLAASTPDPTATFSLSSYFNPVLPGWHSDPSCIYVREHKTFYCATSTFLVTPGIPIFASKDLVNWKLISHVLTRKEQVPNFFETVIDQSCGIFAPTLRYHNGKFYLAVVFVFGAPRGENHGLIFSTQDPYTSSWSIPIRYDAEGCIDPDLFWDDAKDGQAYLACTPITLRTVDLETGVFGPRRKIWGGTGGVHPEGPHIYWKDKYYYLLIGEGGTELNHSVTMARSRDIWGPYEEAPTNPILTAKGTKNYFQTVGHADLFQDEDRKWWGVALSTRSGPEWLNYPMGREAILTPVEWPVNEWPEMQDVLGEMVLRKGRQLPPRSKSISGGSGPWLSENDEIEFTPGLELPPHLSFWRWQKAEDWAISPPAKMGTLKLKPSKVIASATGDAGVHGISLLLRLQTDTLFTYTVDVEFEPKKTEEEAGITVWLTQSQHVNLGIVGLPSESSERIEPHFRLRGVAPTSLPPAEENKDIVRPVPSEWLKRKGAKVRLQIQTKDDTHYTFSASVSGDGSESRKEIVLGSVPGTFVSGGSGKFMGTLVGLYVTSNDGAGETPAYFSRWRYTRDGQKIDHDRIVPSW